MLKKPFSLSVISAEWEFTAVGLCIGLYGQKCKNQFGLLVLLTFGADRVPHVVDQESSKNIKWRSGILDDML